MSKIPEILKESPLFENLEDCEVYNGRGEPFTVTEKEWFSKLVSSIKERVSQGKTHIHIGIFNKSHIELENGSEDYYTRFWAETVLDTIYSAETVLTRGRHALITFLGNFGHHWGFGGVELVLNDPEHPEPELSQRTSVIYTWEPSVGVSFYEKIDEYLSK